jgi:amino acid permease
LPWHWAIIIIVPIFLLQLIHVRVYGQFTLSFADVIPTDHFFLGESEYWLATVKVLMIIVFIFVGLIYDWGGVKHHPGPVRFLRTRNGREQLSNENIHVQGLSNFHHSQAFVGGFSAFAQTIVFAFFSFGGIELVAVAAGESAKPYKAVPRAIKATFFRILLFYILTILTIGLCINYQDETLLTASFSSLFPVHFLRLSSPDCPKFRF